MEKRFRGRVRSIIAVKSDHSCGEMATGNLDDSINWPSVAGPTVPDNNPKLWKTPKLDMSTSLAFLRRELAAMQLQDRGIHKQLLALNNAIRDLKTNLNESWDTEDTSSVAQTIEDVSDGEVLTTTTSLNTQVSHTKQDSGILTDEESGDDYDVFENLETFRPMRKTRSVSALCLPSDFTPELDINHNIEPASKPTTRPRSHTVSEGQFHRVTSMPVINENPVDNTKNSAQFSGKAFAISGFLNKPRTDVRPQSHLGFSAMSRYESMPTISNIGRTSVRHVRSETMPLIRGGNQSSLNSNAVLQSKNKRKPLYKIWRSSSQISLV